MRDDSCGCHFDELSLIDQFQCLLWILCDYETVKIFGVGEAFLKYLTTLTYRNF